MKKLFAFIFTAFALFFFSVEPTFAQTGECGTLQCPPGSYRSPLGVGNNICECVPDVQGGSGQTGDDIFGTIEPPAGVEKYDAASGGKSGLILFLSNIIRIGTVAAGVWVMVNFILAGWAYITSSGDAKAHGDASNKMTYSLIGIVVIVGAYTLAAVIGLVIFGNAGYILNPQFTGVGGV